MHQYTNFNDIWDINFLINSVFKNLQILLKTLQNLPSIWSENNKPGLCQRTSRFFFLPKTNFIVNLVYTKTL